MMRKAVEAHKYARMKLNTRMFILLLAFHRFSMRGVTSFYGEILLLYFVSSNVKIYCTNLAKSLYQPVIKGISFWSSVKTKIYTQK